MDLSLLSPTWQLALSGLFGLVIGSFLNVVILRLPKRMHAEFAAACAELEGRAPAEPAPPQRWFGLDYLLHPGSHCPACGHAISPWENIPILGWLLLRGRCSQCGVRISARYPVIEGLTALVTMGVVMQFGMHWHTLAIALLAWGLIVLAVIDIDEQLLPDQITLPLLWLGLLINLPGRFVPLEDAVIGAVAGYLSLWFVFQLFRLLTGKEGMGYGDFKLLALFGAWLGWQMLPQIILLSSAIGAIIGVALIALRRHERGKPIPFGPYLILGGLVALFWGEQINRTYLHLTGLG
jgi:leader peptidase (prepilin peptidase)/N-methyltransferase